VADLRQELARRKTWFYETQLRRLNYEAFRGVRPDQPGPLLELISEQQLTVEFSGRQIGGRLVDAGRVYLDSHQPVWTDDDDARHGAFAASLIGRMGDWLDNLPPTRLAAALRTLQQAYEATPYQSRLDGALLGFPRLQPVRNPDKDPEDPAHPDENIGRAISRAEMAAAKPWLIPELYNASFEDTSLPAFWVANLEEYVADFETELGLAVGGTAGTSIPFDLAATGLYRGFVSTMLAAASTRPASDAVDVRLVELVKKKPEDKNRLGIGTNGSPLGPVADFRLSQRVRYWAGVIHNPLEECVVLKANSDMGLCQLVRLLYRYGSLPEALGADADLTWRRRKPPDETFTAFFAARAADPAVAGDADLLRRLQTAEAKLRIILEESAAHPRSPDPSFSPLAGEILKQGLTSYKFWLDELPRALDNDRLNKLKLDLGYDTDEDREMEFWSENHYIMFASSEYLLGQLWEADTFQPARVVAAPGDTTGARTGASRRDRGRARVLKWLNNRLMFGWMEFNSSGYYREHLWALLNLVDFAIDDEVRTKATMAVDLMLFDVVRFLHHGAAGAAGGRSQFKSKSHGFDNGLTDVVEMMLGAKGVFHEGDSKIGVSFASSTYVVPQVLLEIGAAPPAYPFTDRSRVSITFDEAPKYGITWSQQSEAKDSVMRGYAPKRARYSAFLDEVNRELVRTHEGYGAAEDDTVFFWGMSAFFNKQVVRNSFRVVHRFGLEKAEVFGLVRILVEYILPLLKSSEGGFLGIRPADLPETVAGAFSGDGPDELDEQSADDLSLFLEGSTRSRANIVTHRSPGAMLSSIQNFRTGQVNFQSSIQQATLNGALNVFVTTGFAGLDISNLAAAAAGLFVGGFEGAVAGVIANEEWVEGINPFGDDTDGPDWWTGYWALPRTVQHGGAAIMASDFYFIQDFLAETGSHAWFPRSGFDRVVERRTSAYDDANFPLLDIGHIGPKGFWLFGKAVHPLADGATGPPEEGYVGVFSNKRPEWLTKESDPYERRLDDKGDDGIWKDPPDLFADRDWYVNGKNIWIVQVGSRSDFGSFEEFMDRVSSARVHVDDTGDLECTYDIPLPGGGSDRLRLTYEGEFELNGSDLETDRFPRFENPFVRGGLVEWGQREYCLEWNGAVLLHDFSDSAHPVREESPKPQPDEAETIRALVIHLRTGDEAMDAFTVATASVDIGCQPATADQVVAAGPVEEETDHDAEWIFFDEPARRSPDMTLTLWHGAPSDRDDEPSWEASYRLLALMGDRSLHPCTVAFPGLQFEDGGRSSGARPFSIMLSRWARWESFEGLQARSWLLAGHPRYDSRWQDHHDLVALDAQHALWHRRMRCAGTVGYWQRVEPEGATPDWSRPFSWAAVSDLNGLTHLIAVADGRLVCRSSSADGRWSTPWTDLAPVVPSVFLAEPVPLGPGSALTAVPESDPFSSAAADLYLTGGDGEVYHRLGWRPGDTDPWQQIATSEFDLAAGARLGVVGGHIVALSTDGTLWIRHHDWVVLFGGGWQQLDGPGFPVRRFAATGTDDLLRLAVRGPAGQVSIGERTGAGALTWMRTSAPDGWRPAVSTDLVWAVPDQKTAWLFATGTDSTVRSVTRDATGGDAGWRPVGAGAGTDPASSLAATCRAEGQIEVFAEADHHLTWTWWS